MKDGAFTAAQMVSDGPADPLTTLNPAPLSYVHMVTAKSGSTYHKLSHGVHGFMTPLGIADVSFQVPKSNTFNGSLFSAFSTQTDQTARPKNTVLRSAETDARMVPTRCRGHAIGCEKNEDSIAHLICLLNIQLRGCIECLDISDHLCTECNIGAGTGKML